MTSSPNVSRRRALQIVASTFGAAVLPGGAARSNSAEASAVWRGTVLNAPASLAIYCEDHRRAENALNGAISEARRLERIFSLYDPASDICRLNATGRLVSPAPELVRLLTEAHTISVATAGAFDATIQPLWRLYAEHFARNPNDSKGPSAAERAAACALVDYLAITISPDELSFGRPGMAISLNGIAQGFVTDRVTDFLRDEGFSTMMVDLGEPRMSGQYPQGASWPVAVMDPELSGRILKRLSISSGAVATSQGAGTVFEPSGHNHHIFDPKSGTSAALYRSVTVVAPTATLADGLSTGLSILPPERVELISAAYNEVGIFAELADGAFIAFTA